MLYSLSAQGLQRWAHGAGGWEVTGSWAAGSAVQGLIGSTEGGLRRYLHDMEGDGTPEVVVVSPRGVHVLGCEGGELVERAVHAVLPPLRLQEDFGQELWPPERRRVTLPARSMSCRVILEGEEMLVVSREGERGGVRYALRRYRGGEEMRAEVTELLGDAMRPCRLNADAHMDFCGGSWTGPMDALLPLPVYAFSMSMDAGRNVVTRRIPGLLDRSAPVRLAEVNGDGRMDLITMGAALSEVGAREAAQQLRLRAAVDARLAVYPQTAEGFAREAACSRLITLALSAPPQRIGAGVEELDIGRRIDPGADFDGDGRADLLVLHRAEEVSVYLWTGAEWDTRAAARALVPRGGRVHAADVDGDGRADLVVEDAAAGQTLVCFNAGVSR
jgi:hypothetical protein